MAEAMASVHALRGPSQPQSNQAYPSRQSLARQMMAPQHQARHQPRAAHHSGYRSSVQESASLERDLRGRSSFVAAQPRPDHLHHSYADESYGTGFMPSPHAYAEQVAPAGPATDAGLEHAAHSASWRERRREQRHQRDIARAEAEAAKELNRARAAAAAQAQAREAARTHALAQAQAQARARAEAEALARQQAEAQRLEVQRQAAERARVAQQAAQEAARQAAIAEAEARAARQRQSFYGQAQHVLNVVQDRQAAFMSKFGGAEVQGVSPALPASPYLAATQSEPEQPQEEADARGSGLVIAGAVLGCLLFLGVGGFTAYRFGIQKQPLTFAGLIGGHTAAETPKGTSTPTTSENTAKTTRFFSPDQLPSGFSLDQGSTSSPGDGVKTYTISDKNGKIIYVSQQKLPTGFDFASFYAKFKNKKTISTVIGPATFGTIADGTSMASIETADGYWVILTNSSGVPAGTFEAIIKSLR